MTWHMSETRHQVERLFGREQLVLAGPSIKSVVDRQDYARYHYQEVRALLSEFASVHLEDRILLDISMAQDEARLGSMPFRVERNDLISPLPARTDEPADA